MDKRLEEFIKQIQDINDVKQYDEITAELVRTLTNENYPEEVCYEIKLRRRYMKNRFSDEINKEKMLESKEKVLEYLLDFLNKEKRSSKNNVLVNYLNHFHLYMEALCEKEPDKRATVTHEYLEKLKIENEYDLQHMLYAVLKPLYPDTRKEVAEDSGVGTVRSDLKIPCLETVIEAKCARSSMNLKKLTEEIEADIVHYSEKRIIFFVYDKWKIIKDKQTYEQHFDRVFDGKEIKMIIHQPINL